jgi:hypothetical protein
LRSALATSSKRFATGRALIRVPDWEPLSRLQRLGSGRESLGDVVAQLGQNRQEQHRTQD